MIWIGQRILSVACAVPGRVIYLVVTVAMACSISGAPALAAGDANKESCSESPTTETSPGFRSYLPDCRAYELVTPPYQGGQPAFGVSRAFPPISPDGEHLLGVAFAGFAGTENEEQSGFEFGAIYEFSRTPSGWTTESLEPPAPQYPRREFVAASADLKRSLWEVLKTEGEEVPLPKEDSYRYAVREVPAAGAAHLTVVGPVVSPDHENGAQGGFGFMGASADLSHIVVNVRSEANQLWPGDKTKEGNNSLYQYVGTSDPEPTIVGVSNAAPLEGKPHLNEGAQLVSECGTILGSRGEGSTYNAVSSDGSVVYFTALRGEGCATPMVNELYARISGSHTVAISEPSLADCGSCNTSSRSKAVFQGASEDGSKVFFISEQKLLPGAMGQNLYEYDFNAEEGRRVVLVAAEVAGVARISEDGSHVYFLAKSVLSTGSPTGSGEKAEEGGYNLYVRATATGGTSFIATLATQGEEAHLKEEIEASLEVKQAEEAIQGEREAVKNKKTECAKILEPNLRAECEVEAIALELKLTEAEQELAKKRAQVAGEVIIGIEAKTRVTAKDERRPFETTRDGRFLAFVNARHLTGAEDTSTVEQIFEYDSRQEGLVRVSVGQCPVGAITCVPSERFGDNGDTTNGTEAPRIVETPEYEAQMKPTDAASNLSLSDGGAVVFTGGDVLTRDAVAGRENVYEYRNGNVYLISPGDEAVPLEAPDGTRLLGTDKSGSNVFFFTTDRLVPQATDTQAGWYDAREAGGFPAPRSIAGCVGDACQGSLSATPIVPLAGGSATQVAGENLSPVVNGAGVRAKPKTVSRAQMLQRALKTCRRKSRRARHSCELQARKRYGRAARPKRREGRGERK